MGNEKSAIIIGAGIGGIATSVFLGNNGYKVDIYEKNSYPGGRCGQILREGHRFDIGATILMMPSIYRDVFESLGLNFDENFELKKLPHVYKVFFGNGLDLTFSNDLESMKKQMEEIEPGSYNNLRKYVSTGYGFFLKAMDQLMGRNFTRLSEFITFKNAALLIYLKAYLKHKTYIRGFFNSRELRQAFTFQNIYVGQSPLDSPALFAMLPAAELSEDSYFPIGGMFSVTEKLMTKAKDLGVNFHFGMPVSKILVSDSKAEKVLFTDGTSKSASIIIANADLPYIYRELLPDKPTAVKLDKKKYACSALVFHWGLNKSYPQLSHHNVFLSPDFEKNLKVIFKEHSLSNNPSFYIHSPVKTDPSAAPPGEDTISVVIPMGHLDAQRSQKMNEIMQMARTAVLRRLKEIGMDDFEDHIKFEICYPPSTWESIFNVSKGSVFGSLKHNIMQMGYFRPHNRHNRYRNLYFVGGSTHPGNGVPLVLLSAKLTSERILQDD